MVNAGLCVHRFGVELLDAKDSARTGSTWCPVDDSPKVDSFRRCERRRWLSSVGQVRGHRLGSAGRLRFACGGVGRPDLVDRALPLGGSRSWHCRRCRKCDCTATNMVAPYAGAAIQWRVDRRIGGDDWRTSRRVCSDGTGPACCTPRRSTQRRVGTLGAADPRRNAPGALAAITAGRGSDCDDDDVCGCFGTDCEPVRLAGYRWATRRRRAAGTDRGDGATGVGHSVVARRCFAHRTTSQRDVWDCRFDKSRGTCA